MCPCIATEPNTYVNQISYHPACSLVGFSQGLSANQQCFPLIINQHQSGLSAQKPTSEQADHEMHAICSNSYECGSWVRVNTRYVGGDQIHIGSQILDSMSLDASRSNSYVYGSCVRVTYKTRSARVARGIEVDEKNEWREILPF